MNHETQVWAGVYAAAISLGHLSTVAKAMADQAVQDFLTSVKDDFKVKE
jgi:hypothetical protein